MNTTLFLILMFVMMLVICGMGFIFTGKALDEAEREIRQLRKDVREKLREAEDETVV